MTDNVQIAKDVLEANGYVVLKAKSYRDAQERQRIAECLRQAEQERREGTERWARDCCNEERRIRDRLTFVYGVARAHGASVAALTGGGDEPEQERDEDHAGQRVCPVCCAVPVGDTDGCPCCDQWRNGIDTNGSWRVGGGDDARP